MQNEDSTGYLDKRGLRTANESNSNHNYNLKINDEELDPKDFYKQYKTTIISIGVFLGFLIICYLIALFKHKKGKNSVIFSMTLILLDFVFDVLFILKNGKDVPWLYKPYLIVLVGPIVINCLLSFAIIVHEWRNNKKFKTWLGKHSQFAAIMTVVAGADIEALKLLISQLAGYEMFDAKFSLKAKRWILYGSVINSLFEDLPQFVIQILYKENTDNDYSLIPFVTLITSTVVLLIDIVGRIYDALNSSNDKAAEDALPSNSRETRGGTK
ncbi:16462_t:CDS:2 [Funneliformis geosporum]|uniref:3708_t:CDS:1 n=1 Tax=Funneliformis geosporum TaxID=1117311 RepID=A0A9W4SI15_9GLOM|nr:16462_t:CDS:2 [Funneliformis geosporum]CAI2170472.1 3708_t:CDS:2 [Funneliformis geosporum]